MDCLKELELKLSQVDETDCVKISHDAAKVCYDLLCKISISSNPNDEDEFIRNTIGIYTAKVQLKKQLKKNDSVPS